MVVLERYGDQNLRESSTRIYLMEMAVDVVEPQESRVEVVAIRSEFDIVKARSKAKGLAREMGFGLADQTRIATAVSDRSVSRAESAPLSPRSKV